MITLLKMKMTNFSRTCKVPHQRSAESCPEHCSAAVLDKMGKPHIESYKRFCKMFYDFTGKENKDQYVVPYLMSSHPGSTLSDAVELALFCKRENIHPKQVQDFYPTPGTISTSMFYTELDPYTLKEVYVPKSENEKAMQRALLQYFIPENKPLVIKALIKAGRRDLIGNDKKCLVTPMAGQTQGGYSKQNNNRNSQNQKGRSKNGKDKFAKYRRKTKRNKIFFILKISVCVLFIACVLLVSFGKPLGIPDWNDVYTFFGISADMESDFLFRLSMSVRLIVR